MIEYVIFVVLASIFILFIRMAKGPTAPDRVLAADTINSLVIATTAMLSFYYANEMLLDIAMVYAILSFLGTLAVSKHLMRREMHE